MKEARKLAEAKKLKAQERRDEILKTEVEEQAELLKFEENHDNGVQRSTPLPSESTSTDTLDTNGVITDYSVEANGLKRTTPLSVTDNRKEIEIEIGRNENGDKIEMDIEMETKLKEKKTEENPVLDLTEPKVENHEDKTPDFDLVSFEVDQTSNNHTPIPEELNSDNSIWFSDESLIKVQSLHYAYNNSNNRKKVKFQQFEKLLAFQFVHYSEKNDKIPTKEKLLKYVDVIIQNQDSIFKVYDQLIGLLKDNSTHLNEFEEGLKKIS